MSTPPWPERKQIPWWLEDADTKGVLTGVIPTEGGWECRIGATCFFVENTLCDDTPLVGHRVKMLGAFGYSIRGIEINDQCYRYRSKEEEDARHQQWVANYHAKKQKAADDQRATRDAKVAAMPQFFRERIERFRNTNPDFRRDNESYEIFACEQAILFQETLKTVEALSEFSKAEYEEQKRLVPGLDEGHSGNTFGAALHLAKLAMTQPELLPKMHGALCPLIGCKNYGCYAANEGASGVT